MFPKKVKLLKQSELHNYILMYNKDNFSNILVGNILLSFIISVQTLTFIMIKNLKIKEMPPE